MPHALGIDIGSVAVKLALVGPEGRLLGVWSRPILRQPAEALGSLICRGVPIHLPEVVAVRIGVTGDGCELVRGPVLPGNRGGGPHSGRPRSSFPTPKRRSRSAATRPATW